ncbi:MAG: hypothetical protein R3E04_06235 [Sphingobium sp.]
MIGDAIAIYGALVASLVALIQFQKHRTGNKVFQVRCSDEYRIADGCVSLTITNFSSREVDIDFAGVGFGYRSWFKPWKIRFNELIGLKIFILNDNFEDVRWHKPLKSGQLVYAELEGGIASLELGSAWSRHGFSGKLYIEITHSLSSHCFIEQLK